jgi:hypothetical protein
MSLRETVEQALDRDADVPFDAVVLDAIERQFRSLQSFVGELDLLLNLNAVANEVVSGDAFDQLGHRHSTS